MKLSPFTNHFGLTAFDNLQNFGKREDQLFLNKSVLLYKTL